jgi:hypothetical protein
MRAILIAAVSLLAVQAVATERNTTNHPILVPESELESLGVSADHKTWQAPDGTIYKCTSGFYATEVKGVGTVWCGSAT